MDWGAKASWIALIVAIISPAITAYLNNRFQLKAKSIDYEFSKQSEYYQYQKNCYENFIKFASKQIETDYKSERIEFCECFHKMLLYLPKSNWDEAKTLYESITNRNPDALEKRYCFTKTLSSQPPASVRSFLLPQVCGRLQGFL